MFKDRREAGKVLAEKLAGKIKQDSVVLALPKGGVPVADEVAKKHNLPIDLILVKKIGHPYNKEYAVGAITESGKFIPDEMYEGISDEKWLNEQAEIKLNEIKKRRKQFYKDKKPLSVRGKRVILVDDGAATGSTILASVKEVKNRGAEEIIVALPVVPQDTAGKIENEVEELVAVLIPDYFAGAVGAYFDNFSQVANDEVVKIMDKYAAKYVDS